METSSSVRSGGSGLSSKEEGGEYTANVHRI